MKVLVLEDNFYRNKKFKQELIGCEVDFCEEAKDAIERIKETTYDLIFLDHDLGGETYVDSNHYNTGYQVAKKIIDTPNKDVCTIIHSLNPAGRNNIQAVLPHALQIPFLNLDIKDVADQVKKENSS